MQALTGTGDFFFEMAGNACAILENGLFIRVNRAWRQVLGRPPEELIARHWMDLFDAGDAERILQAMAKAASNGGRFGDVEARVRHTHEGDRWLIWSGYTDSGLWLLSATDITERRIALGKIEAKARMLDALDAVVVAGDTKGRLTEWSSGAERLFGWSAEEVLGGRLTMAEAISPSAAFHADTVLHSVQGGQWEGELEARCKDGSTIPVWMRCRLLQAEDERPAGFVGIAVNLTAQEAARRDMWSRPTQPVS
jgi:PAS domain S-box-containing protein